MSMFSFQYIYIHTLHYWQVTGASIIRWWCSCCWWWWQQMDRLVLSESWAKTDPNGVWTKARSDPMRTSKSEMANEWLMIGHFRDSRRPDQWLVQWQHVQTYKLKRKHDTRQRSISCISISPRSAHSNMNITTISYTRKFYIHSSSSFGQGKTTMTITISSVRSGTFNCILIHICY